MGFRTTIFVLIWVTALPCVARIEEALEAEKKARSNFIKHFEEFTKDKNVSGIAKSPNGTALNAPEVNRFNGDALRFLRFTQDLTYHPKMYQDEEVSPGLSDHGKNTGDSSFLEREAWQENEKYKKDDKNSRNNSSDDNMFDGMFRLITRDAKSSDGDSSGTGSGGNSPSPSSSPKPEVDRRLLREASTKRFEKAGEQSFETIANAGRDQDKQDDPSQIPNLTLLYYAAQQAHLGIQANVLKNLKQRSVYKAVKGNAPGVDAVMLSEGTPTTEAWKQQALKKLDEGGKLSPKAREEAVKEIEKMAKEGNEVLKAPYTNIAPRFGKTESDPNGPDKLGQEKPENEDGMERDLRVQMEVNTKAGIRPSEVKSAWEYTTKEETNLVSINGDPNNLTPLRPDEQIEMFNQGKVEMVQSLDPIEARSNFRLDKQKLAQPIEQKVYRMDQISRPTQIMAEEFGLESFPEEKAPRTYDDLTK